MFVDDILFYESRVLMLKAMVISIEILSLVFGAIKNLARETFLSMDVLPN